METLTIKMTPQNSSNPTINCTTTNNQLVISDVAYDTYTLVVTSSAYQTYTTSLVVDKNTSHTIDLAFKQTVLWVSKSSTENIPMTTKYIDDPTLTIGTETVTVAGRDGVRTWTWEEEYINGVSTGKERNRKSTITTTMIQREIKRGTKPHEGLTNILTPSNVALSGSTDLQIDGVKATSQVIDDLAKIELRHWAIPFGGVNIGASDLDLDKNYTIAFKYEVKRNVTAIRSTGNGMFWRHKAYVDGTLVSERADAEVIADKYPLTTGVHTFVYQFNTGASGNPSAEIFRFIFNENVEDITSENDAVLWLSEVGIYEGHVQPF